jgi:4-hydroxythreonine-4-phosphate dehydrogenase
MYHDQGQIAMKLMGFERGVTVQGWPAGGDHHACTWHGVRHHRTRELPIRKRCAMH